MNLIKPLLSGRSRFLLRVFFFWLRIFPCFLLGMLVSASAAQAALGGHAGRTGEGQGRAQPGVAQSLPRCVPRLREEEGRWRWREKRRETDGEGEGGREGDRW